MRRLAEYIADLFRPNVRRGEMRIRIRQEDGDGGERVNLNIQCQATGSISTGAAERALAKLIESTARAAGIPADEFWVRCWKTRGEGGKV